MLNCIALKAVSRTRKCLKAIANRMWDRWQILKPSSLITYKVSSRTGDSIPKVVEIMCTDGISQGQNERKSTFIG